MSYRFDSGVAIHICPQRLYSSSYGKMNFCHSYVQTKKRKYVLCNLRHPLSGLEVCPWQRKTVAILCFLLSSQVRKLLQILFSSHIPCFLYGFFNLLTHLCQKITKNLFRHCLNLILLPHVKYFHLSLSEAFPLNPC